MQVIIDGGIRGCWSGGVKVRIVKLSDVRFGPQAVRRVPSKNSFSENI